MLLVTSLLCASGFLACIPGLFAGWQWFGHDADTFVFSWCLGRWGLAAVSVLIFHEDLGYPLDVLLV
jgi:hypothetical protein